LIIISQKSNDVNDFFEKIYNGGVKKLRLEKYTQNVLDSMGFMEYNINVE